MAGVDQVSKLLTAGGTSALSAVSPWTLAAGLPAEAFKLGKGIADRALANKIDRRTQRPMFQIPGAAIEGLNLQRNLAAGQSPGLSQAQNLMAQSQAGNTAAILNSGGSSGERMAALMGQNQIANQGALQLGAQQENWAASQNQNLINQLGQFEDWQQKKWNWDIQQPYEQAKAKAAELRADASQNIYGALRGIGGQAAATIKTGGEDASTLDAGTDNPSPSKITGIQPKKVGTVLDGTELPQRDYLMPEKESFDPTTMPRYGQRTMEDIYPGYKEQAEERARKAPFPPAPEFNPNQGMESYDFNSLSGSEVYSPDGKGPKPLGYDPKTGKINPVAGPPNYNPKPGDPKGPFPIGYKGALSSSNPDAVVSKYAPLFRGISKYITGGI